MYDVSKKNKGKKGRKYLKTKELIDLEGFLMPSKSKKFTIKGETITNIIVVDKNLAHPLLIKKVNQKYKRLIALLTELLISDDDSGDAFRLALNEIEKFRQEVKNKYRAYLQQEELRKMSKQLQSFQKEAKNRYIELQNSLINYENTARRGR